MFFVIDDIFREILSYLGLTEHLILKCTNKFYLSELNTTLITEHNDFRKNYPILKKFSFDNYCITNHFNLAKWRYVEGQPLSYKTFKTVCGWGYTDMAKWMLSKNREGMYSYISYAFKEACNNGRLETAKWLYTFVYKDENSYWTDLFYKACFNQNTAMAEWLFSMQSYRIDIRSILRQIYENVNLETVQWLYNLGTRHNIDMKIDITEEMFWGSPDRNEIIKWLYDRDCWLIDVINSFYILSKKGDVEMAKWLYSKKAYLIDDYIEYCFIHSCSCSTLEFVKWLYSTRKRKIFNYGVAVIESEFYGKLDIHEWLVEVNNEKIENSQI